MITTSTLIATRKSYSGNAFENNMLKQRDNLYP